MENGKVVLFSDWIEIPYEYTYSGHIKIYVEIEGQKYPFILDSGASNMLFGDDRNLSGGFKGFGIGIDSNGTFFLTSIRSVKSLSIGSLAAEDLRFEIKEFSLDCPNEVIGIIGKETMRHHVWQFLPLQKIIRIGKDQRAVLHYPGEDTVNLGINKFGYQLSIYTALNGRKKGRYLVDTGYNGVVSTSLDSAWIPEEGLQIFGVGSKGLSSVDSSENYLFRIDSFQLSKDVIIQGPMTAQVSNRSFKAIGTGLLKKFNFSLDWKNGMMILDPIDTLRFTSRGFGVGFEIDKLHNVYVSSIIENSSAEEVGLLVNQKIISLNGFSSSILDGCSLESLIDKSDTLRVEFEKNNMLNSVKLYRTNYFE